MDGTTDIDPVAVFESLTLEGVDAAIAALNAEIEQWLEPRNRRLLSLTACRRAVEIRENGKKPRAKWGTKTKKPQTQTEDTFVADDQSGLPAIGKIIAFLRVNGTIKVRSLAEHFGIEETEQFRKLLQDPRYFKIDSWGRVNLKK